MVDFRVGDVVQIGTRVGIITHVQGRLYDVATEFFAADRFMAYMKTAVEMTLLHRFDWQGRQPITLPEALEAYRKLREEDPDKFPELMR